MNMQNLALVRAAIGLAQGIALYLLLVFRTEANGLLLAPLLVAAAFVPVIVVSGLGTLRPRTLLIWAAVATAVCAYLGYYDILREPLNSASNAPRVIPMPPLWIALGGGLFIAHSLVVAADAERALVASYARYFDVSWKHAAQLLLATLFLAIFWGVLWLGAMLFWLIQLSFVHRLIGELWFAVPATAVTFVMALHITDVRAGIVRGIRTIKLVLPSWPLPWMTVIAIGFLIALMFTGLDPLWSTRRATATLLTAAAVLVLLINAAYQDGRSDYSERAVLRYARAAAAIVLVPIITLAAYGLALRVQQYGWSPQRVTALACIVIGACYAVGYTVAVFRSGFAIRWLEPTNIATACVYLAVLLALFSPIADPARIAVADQVARLESGTTAPEKFDYDFLRFDSGRYGREALRQLAARPDAPGGAERATTALNAKTRYESRTAAAKAAAKAVTPELRAANIQLVHPTGERIPESFLKQEWTTVQAGRTTVAGCLTAQVKCEAVLVDLNDDGKPELLIFGAAVGMTGAFQAKPDGTWEFLGTLGNSNCQGVREALRRGEFAPVQPAYREIEAGGQRLRLLSTCERTQVAPPPARTP